MKHTKGPWKVHGNTNQGLTIANDSMLGYLAIVPKQADLNQTRFRCDPKSGKLIKIAHL